MTSQPSQPIDLNSLLSDNYAFDSLTVDLEGESNTEGIKLSLVTPNNFSSLEARTDAYVKTLQARIAANIASVLWLGFLVSLIWHGVMISYLSHQMIQSVGKIGVESQSETGSNGSDGRMQAFDKAFSLVGDTAKTLYAVLSPLATVVTGFYFSVKSSAEEEGA